MLLYYYRLIASRLSFCNDSISSTTWFGSQITCCEVFFIGWVRTHTCCGQVDERTLTPPRSMRIFMGPNAPRSTDGLGNWVPASILNCPVSKPARPPSPPHQPIHQHLLPPRRIPPLPPPLLSRTVHAITRCFRWG